MTDWQPIEIPPKDGTTIVVYCERLQNVNVLVRHYRTTTWGAADSANLANSWMKDATHWMALSPPRSNGDEK